MSNKIYYKSRQRFNRERQEKKRVMRELGITGKQYRKLLKKFRRENKDKAVIDG